MTTASDLADARFVAVTTYRRNGVGVPTPVWVAPDGDALAVTTVDGSGKVKRLRNDPHVTLQPCDRRGRVADGAPTVEATAEVVTDPGRVTALTDLVRRKYGVEFRLVMGLERIVGRGRTRIALRITDRGGDDSVAGSESSPV